MRPAAGRADRAPRASVLTADLEARGLVERVAAEGDRRRRVTLPAGEGRRAIDRMGAVWSPRRRCSG